MQTVVTVTDMFCGAGGSSQGAVAAGAEVRIAANHWQLAIETHATNFPDTDHDCADISQVDPRRWPRTTVLWASPECTNHSVGKGVKRPTGQLDMFKPQAPDPEAERSRATMWDVPRFAEYHQYDVVLVENVVDARKWILFDAWIHAMRLLGYEERILYLNSMFFGVPQSRDRMYVVFWKQRMKAPDLDFRPQAYCPKCEKDVKAWQSWKKQFPWGRYGVQYVYRCPNCTTEAIPYITPSLVAIDWSDVGQRIGDRKKPLKPRTMKRIKAGLEKFAGQYLVLDTAYIGDDRARPMTQLLMTQTTRQTQALLVPFLTSVNYFDDQTRPVTGPMPTQTTANKQALTVPPAIVAVLRNNQDSVTVADPLTTITAGGIHHGLLQMPLTLSYANGDGPAWPVTKSLHTIDTVGTQAVVMPFLTSYYQNGGNRPVTEPMGTLSTVDRHGLVTPDVDDCYFRMLKPIEIGKGMAFADGYVVLGNARQKVRQYGNAVTPPVSEWLYQRVAPSLS